MALWSGFDGYLYLTDNSGNVLAYNDDYIYTSQSKIDFTLSSSGTYIVWLTSWSSGSSGTYSLSLTCDFGSSDSDCDFNSDGKTDILWWNPTNGATKIGYDYLLTQSDLNWKLVN